MTFQLESVLKASCPATSLGASADRIGAGASELRSTRVQDITMSHTAARPSRRLGLAYATQSLLTGLPLVAIDLLVTAMCLIGAAYAADHYFQQPFHPGTWNQLSAVLVLQWLFVSLHQLYPGVGIGHVFELRGLTRATTSSFIALAFLNASFGQLPRYEFASFVAAAAATCVTLPFARWLGRRCLAKTNWWGLRVLVLGERVSTLQICQELNQNLMWGFRPVGYGSESENEQERLGSNGLCTGPVANGIDTAIRFNAPVIVIASDQTDRVRIIERLAFQCPAVVSFRSIHSPLLCDNPFQSPCTYATQFNSPLLQFVPRAIKRATDLAICIPAMILLSPIALIIAFLILRRDKGPVFYGHKRIGQHGKEFFAWKFRSMVVNSDQALQEHLEANPEAREEWEGDQKLRDDPRVIKGIGCFMRKWSIDEFPQLWNVMKGEMSLVGPRPIVESEIAKYSEGYFAYSHMVPGLTGLWQVSGRNNTTYEERVKFDEFYAKNWSPWLDIWIMARTPRAVLGNDGAY